MDTFSVNASKLVWNFEQQQKNNITYTIANDEEGEKTISYSFSLLYEKWIPKKAISTVIPAKTKTANKIQHIQDRLDLWEDEAFCNCWTPAEVLCAVSSMFAKKKLQIKKNKQKYHI